MLMNDKPLFTIKSTLSLTMREIIGRYKYFRIYFTIKQTVLTFLNSGNIKIFYSLPQHYITDETNSIIDYHPFT